MSQPKSGPNQTVKQMGEEFERQATRNLPERKLSAESQAACFAGAYNMPARVPTMLRETDPQRSQPIRQRLMNEMGKFSEDYRNGRI